MCRIPRAVRGGVRWRGALSHLPHPRGVDEALQHQGSSQEQEARPHPPDSGRGTHRHCAAAGKRGTPVVSSYLPT